MRRHDRNASGETHGGDTTVSCVVSTSVHGILTISKFLLVAGRLERPRSPQRDPDDKDGIDRVPATDVSTSRLLTVVQVIRKYP